MDNDLEKAILDSLSAVRPLLDDDFWKEFLETPASELCIHHFGLGLYLRNRVLTLESKLYGLFVRAGITEKDDMSSQMLHLWQRELEITSGRQATAEKY